VDKHRKTAIIVGVLILLAYSLLGSSNPDFKAVGMLLEVISGVAVIAIAALMFPYFKPYDPTVSLWYLALKTLEGGLLVVTGVLFLSHSNILLGVRDGIHAIHGYVFAIPALMFYFLLYKSQLVPRWISVWGVVAAVLLVIVNVFEVAGFNSDAMKILYLPIVLNEAFLAIWLMIKGFNSSVIKNIDFKL